MTRHVDYSGMTVNERLFAAGLLADWDAALRLRNRARLIVLLSRVELQEQADQIVGDVLKKHNDSAF